MEQFLAGFHHLHIRVLLITAGMMASRMTLGYFVDKEFMTVIALAPGIIIGDWLLYIPTFAILLEVCYYTQRVTLTIHNLAIRLLVIEPIIIVGLWWIEETYRLFALPHPDTIEKLIKDGNPPPDIIQIACRYIMAIMIFELCHRAGELLYNATKRPLLIDYNPKEFIHDTELDLNPFNYVNFGNYTFESCPLEQFARRSMVEQMKFSDAITRRYALNPLFLERHKNLMIEKNIDISIIVKNCNAYALGNSAFIAFHNPGSWFEEEYQIFLNACLK